jgi:hypothetical protein
MLSFASFYPPVMSLATPPARDYWSTKKDHLYSSCVAYVIKKATGTLVGLIFLQDLGSAADKACFRKSLYAGPDSESSILKSGSCGLVFLVKFFSFQEYLVSY